MVVFCSCCGRDFAEALDLANHTSRPNSICGGALGLGVVQQHERLLADARAAQVAVSNAPAIAAMEKDRRQQHRDDTRAAMLQKLQVQRFGKLRGAPSIADGKALVATAVQQIKPELMRRIAPMLKEGERSVDLLRAVVNETCDVFGQLQLTEHDLLPILSEKGEMAAHAKDLHDTMVHAVERELGWRELRSHDAEGVGFGRMRKRRSFCYDVPVDATLRRLLQCDARAWEQVKSASQRWGSVRDGASGSETILFDIPDAEYFRNHPELGIQADPTDRRIRLAFILYYDGLGTTNAIGAFAHKHSLGLFYYALVNLDPSIRMALPYIQLVTVVYESDIKHFGMELIISGPLDEDEETGTSFGAAMRRLGRPEGIQLSVRGPPGGPVYVSQAFRGWLVLVAADHPAAAKMFGYKEIGGKLPCRGCNWDQGTSAQEAPAAYGRPSSFLNNSLCFWGLRDENSLAVVQKDLEALGAEASMALRNTQVLTPAGYKDEIAALPVVPRDLNGEPTGGGAIGPTGFRRPQHSSRYFHGGVHSPLRMPHAPLTAPQDLMHTIFEGIAKLELAAFLYMAITKYSWFTRLELNAAISAFDWGRGAKPDDIQPSALEGSKGHVPKAGCHVHYHSGVMKNFMLHSERFFTELFVQKGLVAILNGSSDRATPWLSWLQLVKVTVLTLKYSYTMAEVRQLDESIVEHQRIFTSINEYELLYKPKHHFTTHLPHDIVMYGPLRHFWCFRFEAMNQVIKLIAQGSNYMNLNKRIADYWCFKSAADYKSGKLSSWGQPQITSSAESQLVERFAGDIDPSAAIIFRDYFPLETSLMIAAVRELVYAGDTYSTQSWILAQGHLDMHPRLAQVLDIWEVNNGFFFTVELFSDVLVMSSSITMVNMKVTLPLPQGNILVFSATSVLMQPVRYAERQDGTADVSLLL